MTIQVGARVTRLISSAQIPQEMTVTAVDDRFIHCGDWKFDKTYGYEVDEYLGWGVPPPDGGSVITGSYLVLEKEDSYASASAGETDDLPVHRAAGEGPEVV